MRHFAVYTVRRSPADVFGDHYGCQPVGCEHLYIRPPWRHRCASPSLWRYRPKPVDRWDIMPGLCEDTTPNSPSMCSRFGTFTPLLCTCPTSAVNTLTKEVAARSHVLLPQGLGARAITIHRGSFRRTCSSPDSVTLLPTPPWIRALSETSHPQPDIQTRDGLRILSYNIGGVGERAQWLAHVVVALNVDIFLIQEVWSRESFSEVVPSMYRVVFSEEMGVGTGYATGWLRSLECPTRCY